MLLFQSAIHRGDMTTRAHEDYDWQAWGNSPLGSYPPLEMALPLATAIVVQVSHDPADSGAISLNAFRKRSSAISIVTWKVEWECFLCRLHVLSIRPSAWSRRSGGSRGRRRASRSLRP